MNYISLKQKFKKKSKGGQKVILCCILTIVRAALNREHKIPEGSIVVEVCDNEITAYRILAEEKEFLDSAKTNSMNSLIENLAAVI